MKFSNVPVIFSDRLVLAPGVTSAFEVQSRFFFNKDKQVLVIDSRLEKDRSENRALGVLGQIKFKFKLKEVVKLVIEGTKIAAVRKLRSGKDLIYAEGEICDITFIPNKKRNTLIKVFETELNWLCQRELAGEELLYILSLYKKKGAEYIFQLACQLSHYIPVPFETIHFEENIFVKNLLDALRKARQQKQVDEEITNKASLRLDKENRILLLKEKLQVIRDELGGEFSNDDEINELRKSFLAKPIPEAIKHELLKQLDRISRTPADSPEYSMLKTYLDFVSELPWGISTRDNFNFDRTKKILNKNHYGQAQVKERILEYLCVTKLTSNSMSPILCFVGPPGVGKTSFARSIAEALSRKFERVSLGGIRDEAEIRGHRKAYIGSTAGRIIQAIKSARSLNPVIVLDEIDKIGHDFRGDPSSALLEVLDPEQNQLFVDHYLGFPFDISKVIFICTANRTETIPAPLLDRLEVIEIYGYSHIEKEKIAVQFLFPKQLKLNGLEKLKVSIEKDAVKLLIEGYTRESGLRSLDREIAKICRKLAKRFVEKKFKSLTIKKNQLEKLLGPIKYRQEYLWDEPKVGLVIGLAWNELGGDILPLEVFSAKGRGNLNLTGQLGSVMQESAKLAKFYLQANFKTLGIPESFFETLDIHVNAVYGAIPKDGPSAGAALCVGMYSALTGRKIKNTVSMTGELTLSGKILEVGGIREKILASIRYGIYEILIPKNNLKDLALFSKEELAGLTIHPVDNILEILDLAIVK
ncbi:MAG: endopeptidase La [Deltaproteobacteria bacterium]|nr:endopeptidase La [Deltaproteobacteria bacterium]